jgi:NADH-quinone oxidoreductase subunit H
MIVRWSWPRFRFDQLMSLAWKVMLPLGLLNLAVMACLVEAEQSNIIAKGNYSTWMIVGIVTMLVGWIGSAMFSPLAPDNRPRKGATGLLEPEQQLT